MTKKAWLCTLGAVLLASAAPVISAARKPAAAQSSVRKRKAASAKKKSKRTPRGQNAPTSDRIREIQGALARQGAFNGEPTGKWDHATFDAMKTFQENHRLIPTGKTETM